MLMSEAGVEFGGVMVSLRAGSALTDNVNFRTLISNLAACFRCFLKDFVLSHVSFLRCALFGPRESHRVGSVKLAHS